MKAKKLGNKSYTNKVILKYNQNQKQQKDRGRIFFNEKNFSSVFSDISTIPKNSIIKRNYKNLGRL